MNAALRILDVNLNRAREALRCIEDYARFALDDADGAWRAKLLRHGSLRAIVAIVGQDRLLESRDILADVGVESTADAERRRESTLDVARAAFGRISEAARAISEYGKTLSPEVPALAERLRYDAYALEQAILLRSDGRRRLRQGGLYVLITANLCRGDWLETAAAALRGGARILQLREKSLPDRELLQRARALREITRHHDALLIVNDRPDIARLSGADGVHLGQDDLRIAEARSLMGPRAVVGVSTHTIEQFETARTDAPDYIAVGPMFQSSTKPQDHVAGITTLARVAETGFAQLVAIGGINASNAASVLQAGAHWLCVCSTILSDSDPEAAARKLSTLIASRGE